MFRDYILFVLTSSCSRNEEWRVVIWLKWRGACQTNTSGSIYRFCCIIVRLCRI